MTINYSKQAIKIGANWVDIEEIEPDDWDMQMLSKIKDDPECHEFVSEKDAMRELELS